MARYIEVWLTKRGVCAIARLLEEEAPKTVEAVWNALPIEGPAYHAKYASNEVYTLVKPFATEEPPLENGTIAPLPGDILYFFITPAHPLPRQLMQECRLYGGLIDLAVFYGRNNFLLSPIGFLPGSVFAIIEEGLATFADACNDVWRAGAVGEQLVFRRAER